MADSFDLFGDTSPDDQALLASRSQSLGQARQAILAKPIRSAEERRRRYVNWEGRKTNWTVLPAVWSSAECDHILEAIQDIADREGWESDRHSAFPTTDLPLTRFPEALQEFVRSSLTERVLHTSGSTLGFEHGDLAFVDLFFVRYEASGQRMLSPHTDGCLLSFNVLLNSPNEFEGGGTTVFPSTASTSDAVPQPQTIHIRRGDCLLHDSKIMHSGNEVTHGQRIICVGFVDTQRDGHARKVPGQTHSGRMSGMLEHSSSSPARPGTTG
ncbi:uncharacterized protein BJ171DRAFT_426007 [Polychytrium aggregatum]|uniref:uncharacterized protein n=1 Tax=Polychytrium aggregatum TaxID=110093 RepID=UPI0022FDB8E9|nr:uncharacterized protein BJ171DRAFT_426007 [Polychytrium aggregatum]KAI9202837.1 hypothetical protein BJ171DRAFT_426007 [Polychytrium aggregatum]